MKSDRKVAGEAKALELQINRLAEEISTKKKDIKDKMTSLEVFSKGWENLKRIMKHLKI